MRQIQYKSKKRMTSLAQQRKIMEQLALYKQEENFDFKGLDTQYSTHAIHTYVAAMVPQLAEHLVTTYVPIGEKILDPFCGGGAVLVESVRHDRKAYGSDINPLAVLLSKVKSTYVLKKEIETACGYVSSTAIRNLNGSLSFPPKYNLEYWFFPHTIAELSSLSRVIQKCERENKFSKDVLDILRVVFSASVRDVMLTYRNEVRLRRLEPDDLKKFKPNAFNSFSSRGRIATERIGQLPQNARSVVERSPVQQLEYPDKEFHSIICSPPYGDERNGVSYLQFSKYMLYWLGFTRENVIESRKNTLGSSKRNLTLDSPTLEKATRAISKKDDDSEWINFYKEYYLGLDQMIRVTKENVIIVIGNRVLKQTVIENGKITTEFMENLGFRLYKHYERTLPSKRLPKLRRETNHGFGGAIDKEDILIYRPK